MMIHPQTVKQMKAFRSRLKALNPQRMRTFAAGPPFGQAILTDDHQTPLGMVINLGEITVDYNQPLAAMMARAGVSGYVDEDSFPFDTAGKEAVRVLLAHFAINVHGLKAAASFIEALGLYQASLAQMIEIVHTHGEWMSKLIWPQRVDYIAALRPVSKVPHHGSMVTSYCRSQSSITSQPADHIWYANHRVWFACVTV